MVSSECLASASVCHAWSDGAKRLGAGVLMLTFRQGAIPDGWVFLTRERIGKQGLQALRALAVPAVPIA